MNISELKEKLLEINPSYNKTKILDSSEGIRMYTLEATSQMVVPSASFVVKMGSDGIYKIENLKERQVATFRPETPKEILELSNEKIEVDSSWFNGLMRESIDYIDNNFPSVYKEFVHDMPIVVDTSRDCGTAYMTFNSSKNTHEMHINPEFALQLGILNYSQFKSLEQSVLRSCVFLICHELEHAIRVHVSSNGTASDLSHIPHKFNNILLDSMINTSLSMFMKNDEGDPFVMEVGVQNTLSFRESFIKEEYRSDALYNYFHKWLTSTVKVPVNDRRKEKVKLDKDTLYNIVFVIGEGTHDMFKRESIVYTRAVHEFVSEVLGSDNIDQQQQQQLSQETIDEIKKQLQENNQNQQGNNQNQQSDSSQSSQNNDSGQGGMSQQGSNSDNQSSNSDDNSQSQNGQGSDNNLNNQNSDNKEGENSNGSSQSKEGEGDNSDDNTQSKEGEGSKSDDNTQSKEGEGSNTDNNSQSKEGEGSKSDDKSSQGGSNTDDSSLNQNDVFSDGKSVDGTSLEKKSGSTNKKINDADLIKAINQRLEQLNKVADKVQEQARKEADLQESLDSVQASKKVGEIADKVKEKSMEDEGDSSPTFEKINNNMFKGTKFEKSFLTKNDWKSALKKIILNCTGVKEVWDNNLHSRRIKGAYGTEREEPTVSQVGVILDVSGSMSWDKFKPVCEEIEVVAQLLGKCKSIIAVWSDDSNYKKSANLKGLSQACASIFQASKGGGNNITALSECFQVVRKCDVIIHLTDGWYDCSPISDVFRKIRKKHVWVIPPGFSVNTSWGYIKDIDPQCKKEGRFIVAKRK